MINGFDQISPEWRPARRAATGERFRVPSRAVIVLSIFITALVAGPALALAAAAPQRGSSIPLTPRLLVPRTRIPIRLAPGQQAGYSLYLKSGEFAEISVEQSEGLVQAVVVKPDGKQGVPHLLDAGRGSVIRLPVVADQDGVYHVRVVVRVAEPEGTGAISVSAPLAASLLDRRHARAWDQFAQAEWIRKKKRRNSQAAALRDYNAAFNTAESMKDWTLARASVTGKSRILLFNLADYPRGRDVAQMATAVPGAGQDPSGEALAWKTLSSAESYLGDYAATIAAANKALALYRTTGDLYWQGIVLGNMAYSYRRIGENGKARAAGEAALKIARSVHDLVGVDYDLGALAATEMAQGDFGQAFDFYYQALGALHQKPYPEAEANDWLGLGDVYEQLGDRGRAQNAFEKALAASRKAADSSDEVATLGFLGDIEASEHHPAEALADYQRGLGAAESQHLRSEQSFLLVELGRAYSAEGQRERALAADQKALAIATAIAEPSGQAEALQAIGDLQAASGHSAEAVGAYSKAFAIWSAEGHRAQMGRALASLARAEFVSGNLAAADDAVTKALSLIESARATISSRELRTTYFASRHNYYDLAVDILMALDRRHPGGNYSAQAMAVADRAKARTLLDEIENSRAAAPAGIPAALVSRERNLREQLNAAYGRLRDAMGADPKSKPAVSRIEAQIEKLLHESDLAGAQMRDASPRYAALAGQGPASLSDLEGEASGAHRALLEYWTGNKESFLWLVTQRRLLTVRLPSSRTLARLIRQYRSHLLARDLSPQGEGFVQRHDQIRAADARASSEAFVLGRMLLGDAPRLTGVNTLVIVPDGPLWQLPFSALRLRVPRSRTAPGRIEYAAVRFNLVEEPSASVLLSLMQHGGPAVRVPRVAIFADPVYARSDPRIRGRIPLARSSSLANPDRITRMVTEAGMDDLPRLMGSRQEALKIDELAGPKNCELRLGFAARPQAVRATDWNRYTIAHFAAHAMINPLHPAFSGIVLSMVNRRGFPVDGVLWLSDIYSLQMPVSLVVLSGCRTAAGRDIPGEGVAGLSRAFFYAGAERVLGSLWSVEDRQTSALMQAFYFHLMKKHLPAGGALRTAQIEMMGDKQSHAPYFWAGFILQGSPN